MQSMRWNPDEDMELPIWHPGHVVHMRHLDFNAQLVRRRCSVEDVEDFLVGVTEITPRWADRMLRPLVESASRRKVVQRSLANKTKRNLSNYEWDLLNWNVDADTQLDWAVERAMEARERIPADTSIAYAGNLEASGPASTALISPFFKWVWGVTQEDVDSVAHNQHLVVEVPDSGVRNVVQICFNEPLHSFFTRSSFYGDSPDVSSTNIFSWGKMASLWGYPRPQNEHTPSAPFVRVLERGLVDWNVEPIIETMYRLAQEELARVTAVVTMYYVMEYAPGGKIPYEQRQMAKERYARREKLAKRRHSGWKASGFRDTTVDVVAAYYADVFGVT